MNRDLPRRIFAVVLLLVTIAGFVLSFFGQPLPGLVLVAIAAAGTWVLSRWSKRVQQRR